MLASRMAPRESIITPRHGDCECRRADVHVVTEARDASRPAVAEMPLRLPHRLFRYLPANDTSNLIPPICLVAPGRFDGDVAAPCARHATPVLSMTASTVFDDSNCEKTLYSGLHALGCPSREATIPRRSGNRLVNKWCL